MILQPASFPSRLQSGKYSSKDGRRKRTKTTKNGEIPPESHINENRQQLDKEKGARNILDRIMVQRVRMFLEELLDVDVLRHSYLLHLPLGQRESHRRCSVVAKSQRYKGRVSRHFKLAKKKGEPETNHDKRQNGWKRDDLED